MDNLKIFQPIHTVKTDKAYSKENTKGVSEKPSHKEISHKFNRSAQQKPGIDCITSAETLPARTKGNRKKQDRIKHGRQTSGILQGGTTEFSIYKQALLSSKKRE